MGEVIWERKKGEMRSKKQYAKVSQEREKGQEGCEGTIEKAERGKTKTGKEKIKIRKRKIVMKGKNRERYNNQKGEKMKTKKQRQN